MLTSFKILDQVQMNVRVDVNPFGFALPELFTMGARVNPKRSFLFISKLIGKHLDVHPDIPKATGHLLANMLTNEMDGFFFSDVKKLSGFVRNSKNFPSPKEELEKRHMLQDPTLFIGFAETATGLGHAVFSAFDNAFFVHTTREELDAESVFDFKEEHSHAVDHRCYLLDQRFIEDAEKIVLIDDEMTTGKTTLNLIRSLHRVYPKKTYYVLSILDWRTEEQEASYRDMEKELGISIVALSLIRGTLEVEKDTRFEHVEEIPRLIEARYEEIHQSMNPREDLYHPQHGKLSYVKDTGRFGLLSLDSEWIEKGCKQVGESLAKHRRGDTTLVMGTGELMYLPSRIASYMGEGVTHKTTTRSPIYPHDASSYPIYERLGYTDDNGVQYYMYNLSGGNYSDLFFLFEIEPSVRMKNEIASALQQVGVNNVTFVTL